MTEELFKKYFKNLCTPAEAKELLALFNDADNERVLRKLIRDCLEDDVDDEESKRKPATDEMFAAINNQLNSEKRKSGSFFNNHLFAEVSQGKTAIELGENHR
jgi:hypothetical protein